MSANINPIFGLTPNTPTASLGTTPNTASDGSGTLVTIFTAGANGSRVDSVRVTNAQATAAASTANIIRLYKTDNAGANPRLIDEQSLPTATRTTAVVGATVTFTFGNGYFLLSGELLKACQSVYAGVQDLIHSVSRGIDY